MSDIADLLEKSNLSERFLLSVVDNSARFNVTNASGQRIEHKSNISI